MSSLDYLEFLIETPGGKPRISLEGIQIIGEPVRQKVEKIISDREFTLEQKNIVNALLFFLKRDSGIKLSQTDDSLDYNSFDVVYENHKIGDIYYDKTDKRIWAKDVFSLNEDLKDNGLGILAYVRLAILSSFKNDIMHSDLITSISPEAENVWKRLVEVGLAKKNTKDYYFVNLAFLTAEDFEIIDKILAEENSVKFN